MAGQALNYCDTIDSFVSRNKDLHALELSDTDWESIKLVTSWLKSFRSATTEMSTTKVLMLSTTHTIFRGLQDDIKNILRDLPNSVSPKIKLGLTDAHRKLSDYYHQFDDLPFYIWAARTWIRVSDLSGCFLTSPRYRCLLGLDPWITYEGMKADYADDSVLSDHLEEAKLNLIDYFNVHYANRISLLSSLPLTSTTRGRCQNMPRHGVEGGGVPTCLSRTFSSNLAGHISAILTFGMITNACI
jgi:hypothetical protein